MASRVPRRLSARLSCRVWVFLFHAAPYRYYWMATCKNKIIHTLGKVTKSLLFLFCNCFFCFSALAGSSRRGGSWNRGSLGAWESHFFNRVQTKSPKLAKTPNFTSRVRSLENGHRFGVRELRSLLEYSGTLMHVK
jgi:hypothetical protein